MPTCQANKTGNNFCQPLKLTSFSVLGKYAKHVFGVLSKYAKWRNFCHNSVISCPKFQILNSQTRWVRLSEKTNSHYCPFNIQTFVMLSGLLTLGPSSYWDI
jgi:hypothetical protein